jgi:hypothetical protein
MSNLLDVQNRINTLLSRFVAEVKGSTAMSHTDLDKVAETVLVPLFKQVYGFRMLQNLNFSDGMNFPAVDLGDDEKRIAFQITSTSSSEKVKHTLEKFAAHQLYTRFDRLIVYILTEKQSSYSGQSFPQTFGGNFRFDIKTDIQDYTDLLRVISDFPIEKAEKVKEVLEAHFGEKHVQGNSPQQASIIVNSSGDNANIANIETMSGGTIDLSRKK